MSSSNIIVDVKYRTSKNIKSAIKNWSSYTVDPKKCDSISIDDYDVLKDAIYYSDNEDYLNEKIETFAWNSNGDIDVKKDIKNKPYLNREGTIWNILISFPNEFALNNGLVTKKDFYSLTNGVLPSFLMNAGFKLNNTNWYSVLHRNTKSPHMHIIVFEKEKTKTRDMIDRSSINKLKSLIANYVINNEEFYITRDRQFKDIIGNIGFQEFAKIKSAKMFGTAYRKELNTALLSLYKKLPTKGRLQYNSKNMLNYKTELDSIIELILKHDSIKYKYEEYRILLMEKQRQYNDLYGTTKNNINNKYMDNQIKKIYSTIGNDILNNFKIYQSSSLLEHEKQFLKKHINDLNFKSRNDYFKKSKRIDIAKSLYKLCVFSELNYDQTKKVMNRWITKSKYDFNSEILLSSFTSTDSEMSSTELYSALKKLGYDYDKYKKIKDKNFYREINYKSFFNRAINHVLYELDQEQKNMIENIRYELGT